MAKRNLYLNTTPVEEAKERYLTWLEQDLTGAGEQELIPVTESLGRVTAEAVYAVCSSPLFNAAAMDGIAVISKSTAVARSIIREQVSCAAPVIHRKTKSRDNRYFITIDFRIF